MAEVRRALDDLPDEPPLDSYMSLTPAPGRAIVKKPDGGQAAGAPTGDLGAPGRVLRPEWDAEE
jgi:hypothetical protein